MAKRCSACYCMMLIPFCFYLHPTPLVYGIVNEEVLVQQVVSMKKMSEKPGHVRPANGFYDKLNALKFVPQQELSREQAYWLPSNENVLSNSNPNCPVIKEKNITTKSRLCSENGVLIMQQSFVEQQNWSKPTSGSQQKLCLESPLRSSLVLCGESRYRNLCWLCTTQEGVRIYNNASLLRFRIRHVAFDELTEGGLDVVKSVLGLCTSTKYFSANSTELELNLALQSGRSRSALVKSQNLKCPSTKKKLSRKDAPEVTENLLPPQNPYQKLVEILLIETLFDHVDSNVFDTHNAPETDSEASHSNSVNIDVTPNNQLPHVQKWTQAHPLENIIGDKDRPVSTRKQLRRKTDAMWGIIFSGCISLEAIQNSFIAHASEYDMVHLPDGGGKPLLNGEGDTEWSCYLNFLDIDLFSGIQKAEKYRHLHSRLEYEHLSGWCASNPLDAVLNSGDYGFAFNKIPMFLKRNVLFAVLLLQDCTTTNRLTGSRTDCSIIPSGKSSLALTLHSLDLQSFDHILGFFFRGRKQASDHCHYGCGIGLELMRCFQVVEVEVLNAFLNGGKLFIVVPQMQLKLQKGSALIG
ncbi:hypothetical protein Tco_1466475 [Tanacetum coccineum]